VITFTAKTSHTLLDAIHTYVAEKLSKRAIKRTIDLQGCLVNGKIERFASQKVHPGDKIEIHLAPIEKKQKIQWEKERILYEDNLLLIYNKPAGISVDNEGLESIIPFKAPLVHRLDKETTGILILAKNNSIATKLQNLFKERKIVKEYLAIVEGSKKSLPLFSEARMESYKPHQGKILSRLVNKGGKEAKTYFEILCSSKKTMLLLCKPVTGRTHQIRLHCIDIGHPILGDYTYCREYLSKCYPERILLHAFKITFNHPETGVLLSIEAPLPQDFIKYQKELGLCAP
jgi:RluA family pseudouridine synthase